VLIGPDGQPRICDFGCSKIIGIKGFTTALPSAYRFMAPELVEMETEAEAEAETPPPTLSHEADVYAFAMVSLEVRLLLLYTRSDAELVASQYHFCVGLCHLEAPYSR
jgi:hypothetical protein